ncbi:MAG TPA: hypothetical protein DDY78_10240 [Planctomycetales bacterium]|jgi:hypothetical protein|nr:hypothetical protein [Planctomycetales bacterium]
MNYAVEGRISDMPAKSRRMTAFVWLVCSAHLLVVPACKRAEVAAPNTEEKSLPPPLPLVVVYRNDFNGPVGRERR